MTTIRFLFILLLLLNVLAFAALRGWLGLGQPVEPEKTASGPTHPERVRIGPALPPPPPPVADPKTCLAWSGLSTAQNTKLISLLAAAGIQATTRDTPATATWKVRVPPLPTREAAEILVNNMLTQGFDRSSLVIEETGNGFGISLGMFRDRPGAVRYLETVKTRGVYNADIETRSGSERRVEATAVTAKIDAALTGQPFAKRYKPCPP
jgi:hypothetical protein